MAIQPASVTLIGGESCAFNCDAGSADWTIAPDRGTMSSNGVYTAPQKWKVWFSTTITVEARTKPDGKLCGTAAILLSAAPAWITSLAAFFAVLLILLCLSVFLVWPPPAESPWIDADPPVVTIAPKGSQMFNTTVWHTRDQGVTWSATGGLIMPNGQFTATDPLKKGDRLVVTAAKNSDHTLTGTALVIINDTSLRIDPAKAFLNSPGSQTFQAVDSNDKPAKLTWSVSDSEYAKVDNGVVTVRAKPPTPKRVIVTATDTAADPQRQASALLYLNPAVGQDGTSMSAVELEQDRKLILLVMLIGALGALLAASRSLANFVGNKTFEPSWSLYYLLRPLFGAGLAAIVFFGYRIGAVSGLKDATPADPFRAAFVAGIVGLFADTVLQKLKDTIDALLPSKDDRSNKLNSSKTATAPSVTSAQGAITSKQMTVRGQGFLSGATVTLNGQAREVTFVDATQLRVTLTDADKEGPVTVIVTNPDKQASAAFDAEIQA
jgi:hypothetical protein